MNNMNKVEYFRNRFAEEFNNKEYKKAVDTGRRLLYEQAFINRIGTENYINDMFNLGLAYENMGDIESAIEIFRGSAWYSSNLDNEGLLFAKCLTELAALLGEIGQDEPAYFMHAKACDILEGKLEANDPAFADSLYNLANAANEIDMPAYALHYHLKALKIREAAENKDDIINSLHSIAFIFESNEAYEEACGFAKNAVEHAQEVDDDLTYAVCCTYLADLYTKCDKLDDALDMYSIAADEIEFAVGKEHSAYLNSAFMKATILAKMSLYEEAITAYWEILDIFEDYLGTNHLFYANCLRNLAIVYENSGNLTLSKKTMLIAIRIKRTLKSCAILDIIFVLRLTLKLGLIEDAIYAVVYALMCLKSSSWDYSQGRSLILSVMTSEYHDEKSVFLDELEKLENSDRLKNIIDYWLEWEKT